LFSFEVGEASVIEIMVYKSKFEVKYET